MRPSKEVRSEGSLYAALKQEQPFRSPQQEAYLSIVRTATELSHSTEQFLKNFGLTQAQYNVLRILQGAGPEGLGRNELAQRMISVTPDMTRLLDRLESASFISRTRDRQDKRQTSTTITDAGRALLEQAEGPLLEHHHAQLQALSSMEIKRLLASFDSIRNSLRKLSEPL